MSIEAGIFTALRGLVADRVYPDIAPQGVTALPRITYFQVGGNAINFLDTTLPSKKNARFQINCWGATRLQASSLARQVEDTLRQTSTLFTTVLSAPVAIHEPESKLYGTHQDFSFYYS